MIVDRVINNNIVSTIDDEGAELILMGRGLGFGTKSGNDIDESKVEKIFKLEDQNDAEQLKQLLLRVPLEEAEVVGDIVSYAKEKIAVNLNSSVYVTLTDHINFAIERQKQNIDFTNPLLWEIKRYYPSEFQVGCYALDLIKQRFDVQLTEDEAGFIALHFVNSEYDTSISDAAKFPTEIHKILDLIHHEFNLKVDEKSLNYERLLTHVKFLLQRVYRNEMLKDEDLLIIQTIKRQCEKEFDCCRKISSSIKEATGKELTEAEMVYMAIHIRRLLNTNKERKQMFNLFKKKETKYSVHAVANGTTVALKDVPDPTFAEEMIGKGVAIIPTDGKVVAPVSGTVSMVFPTNHAVGLVDENGVEVLVHIGIDTVSMKGEGFTGHVKQGDTVKAGDLMIEVDLDKVKEAGFNTIIPVIITNTPSFTAVEGFAGKDVKVGDEVISITK